MSDTATDSTTTNPWDSDLEAAFEDEAQRQAVSDFLGKTVQPYVTKLEQDSRPDRDASLLWEQYHEKPVDTSIQVVKELFGDDVAEQFADILQGKDTTEENTETETTTEETPVTETKAEEQLKFEQLPADVQELLAATQQEKQREAYYNELERITKEHSEDLPKDDEGNPQINSDLFHPFVVSADGNFDEAYEGFKKFMDNAKETFGIKVPGTDTVVDENTPPATLNSETRDSSAKPPTEVQYESIDAAMDDMFKEMKSPPPTVGGV